MLHRIITIMAAAVVIAGSALFADAQLQNRCGSSSLSSSNLLVIGLTSDQRLVCFSEFSAGRLNSIGQVTGLAGDTALIGMDYRVQDGKLYAVGNAGGVYTINLSDASATLVNNLTIPLSGTVFGVDFNPAADRLRIISNTGQNLRHNVNPGGVTINDGTLTYTAPPATPVAALGVTSAAYTNNDLDANTATTLFDVDTALDQISIQSPANNGILVATGKLGTDATEFAGFDIYTGLTNGSATSNRGFAVLNSSADGVSRFYTVSILTGRASIAGTFPQTIVDIAIPLNQ